MSKNLKILINALNPLIFLMNLILCVKRVVFGQLIKVNN